MGCKREGQEGWHEGFCRRERNQPAEYGGVLLPWVGFCCVLLCFEIDSLLIYMLLALRTPRVSSAFCPLLFPCFPLLSSPKNYPKPAKRSSGILLVFLSGNKPSKEVKKGLHSSLCKPFNMKYTNCNVLFYRVNATPNVRYARFPYPISPNIPTVGLKKYRVPM